MIDKITINGFKSFVNTEVELGAFNVFIGANGSGKSNLLEAFGVASAAAFGSVEPETLRYRGVRLGTVLSYKEHFRNRTSGYLSIRAEYGKASYSVSFRAPEEKQPSKWRFGAESLALGDRKLLSRQADRATLSSEVNRDQKITIGEDQSAAMLALKIQSDVVGDVRDLMMSLDDFAIFSPMTLVMRGLMDDVSRDPVGLGGSGLTEVVRDLLSEDPRAFGPFDFDDLGALIEWADDISIMPSSDAPIPPTLKSAKDVLVFRDKYQRDEFRELSAYDASEGSLYILFLLALAAHPRMPSTLAVDNFDHALHPRVACNLARVISKEIASDGVRQMLVTTHNPLVLDGLDLLNDHIRLFTVDRDPDGVSQVKRIEITPELAAQSDKGLSLSRLWLMGRLGGMPQLL